MTATTGQLLNDFAPTGVLRCALNHGNRVLVARSEDGTAKGITVDLSKELARFLGLPLEFVEYERAVDVSSRAGDDVWDVCFLAVDPKRAEQIHFTAPYIRIEGSYLAAAGCSAADAISLVKEGHKVGTVDGSAYTLHLDRQVGAEHLVVYPDIFTALAALDQGEVMAVAGIRDVMEAEAEGRPGARVLHPPFMEILQAMGVPANRREAGVWLTEFAAQLARSGRVGEILQKHGVSASCAVVPD